MESSQNTQAGQAASPSQPKVGPVLGTESDNIARTSHVQRTYGRLVTEAHLLASIAGGQSHIIRDMSEELESLRRMNDRQADTIAKLERQAADKKGFYNMSVVEFARICREAEFGRKMAASAGVNIA